jgi:hypothetical protein
VLPGRRNNPGNKEAGIRPLAVFGPIHYQELPELFMDFVASLTGKSPSTTGAGSEGALTKGPFNALLPVVDLNAALLSYLMTGYQGFSTAAGYVGPKYRVDHDVSLVVPEIWSRMFLHERRPEWLIENGYLEAMQDFDEEGETIFASRLGYRITSKFVETFFGRMFTEPGSVFTEDMLRPELQDHEQFVDGIKNITETQQRVAMAYFEDGGIDLAIPPLRAILHIMAYGEFEGKTIHDPEVRGLFDRDLVLASDWYQDRLTAKKDLRLRMMRDHIRCLEEFLDRENYSLEAERLELSTRLEETRVHLAEFEANPGEYIQRITGTIGVEPKFYE